MTQSLLTLADNFLFLLRPFSVLASFLKLLKITAFGSIVATTFLRAFYSKVNPFTPTHIQSDSSTQTSFSFSSHINNLRNFRSRWNLNFKPNTRIEFVKLECQKSIVGVEDFCWKMGDKLEHGNGFTTRGAEEGTTHKGVNDVLWCGKP